MVRLSIPTLAFALLLMPLAAAAQEPAPSAASGAAAAGPGPARPAATPTEQLFDAIAVGQIDAVRDAIARGANVNARNVLGQRPVDLAIDVGRSDIAFLLLSMMRAGQAERRADQPAAAPAREPRRPPARATVPAAAAVPAPARFPVRWANDGGAPQPEIGFLGFDASRPDGAHPPPGATRAAAPSRRPGRVPRAD